MQVITKEEFIAVPRPESAEFLKYLVGINKGFSGHSFKERRDGKCFIYCGKRSYLYLFVSLFVCISVCVRDLKHRYMTIQKGTEIATCVMVVDIITCPSKLSNAQHLQSVLGNLGELSKEL